MPSSPVKWEVFTVNVAENRDVTVTCHAVAGKLTIPAKEAAPYRDPELLKLMRTDRKGREVIKFGELLPKEFRNKDAFVQPTPRALDEIPMR